MDLQAFQLPKKLYFLHVGMCCPSMRGKQFNFQIGGFYRGKFKFLIRRFEEFYSWLAEVAGVEDAPEPGASATAGDEDEAVAAVAITPEDGVLALSG